MFQKMRVLLLVCFTAVLVACGGGGGAGESAGGTTEMPLFAGKYLMSGGKLISNNCSAAVPATMADGTDVVMQDGRAIAINSNGTIFNGSVDADNGGFTVVNTQVSSGVTVSNTVSFRTITAGSKYQFKLDVSAGACSAVYSGTATKI